jgi:dynein heavy chain
MGEELLAQFAEIKKELNREPEDIEQLTNIREYMETVPQELAKLEIEAKKVTDVYNIMVDDFNLKVSDELFMLKWDCFKGAKDCYDVMEERNVGLTETMKGFFKDVQDEQFQFDDTLAGLQAEITNFVQFTDLSNAVLINETAVSISERLKSNAEQAKQYNIKESLFGVEAQDYSNIAAMGKEWEPFSILWQEASQWMTNKPLYYEGSFADIDPKKCEDSTEMGKKILHKALKTFNLKAATNADYKKASDLVEQIKGEMTDFSQYMPLIVAMRNEGMKDRHWVQITEAVGKDVSPAMTASWSRDEAC